MGWVQCRMDWRQCNGLSTVQDGLESVMDWVQCRMDWRQCNGLGTVQDGLETV